MAFTFPTDTNSKAGAVRQNEGGTGFHVPAVIYDTDGVTPFRNAFKQEKEFIYVHNHGSFNIPAGETITIYETNKDIIINRFEWYTDSKTKTDVRAQVGVSGIFGTLDWELGGTGRTTAEAIAKYGNPLFKILEYDESNNNYKFANKDQIEIPGGFKVELRNTSTQTQQLGVIIMGVAYK